MYVECQGFDDSAECEKWTVREMIFIPKMDLGSTPPTGIRSWSWFPYSLQRFAKAFPKSCFHPHLPLLSSRAPFAAACGLQQPIFQTALHSTLFTLKLRQYIIVSNGDIDRVIVDRFNHQAQVFRLKRAHSSHILTVIRNGSFENTEDAVRTILRDRTTPRMMPTGTERLSKHDFFISKFS